MEGSASIAKSLGLSSLIIGLTIVSLGTSAPEILVSLNAALTGAGELAVGNALGSNLANVGLVLGITTLVARLPVQSHLLTQEMPILLAVTALSGLFLFNAQLSRFEGWTLLLCIAPIMGLIIYLKRRSLSSKEIEAETDIPDFPINKAVMLFILGLVLLVASSRLLVWGAIETATFFGVSPLIIGLTVVAIGTSLPELAASVMSALRGHHDIALGNIIGSNILNLLAVMSIPALITPLQIDAAVFQRDFLVMALLTLTLTALIGLALWHTKRQAEDKKIGPSIGKPAGVILLLGYAAYCLILVRSGVISMP